jgi:hypothetical protein
MSDVIDVKITGTDEITMTAKGTVVLHPSGPLVITLPIGYGIVKDEDL